MNQARDLRCDFDARWLAEALRQREMSIGPIDDADAISAGRAVGGGLETRILARADYLGGRSGVAAEVSAQRGRMNLMLVLVNVLALALGVMLSIAVAGDPARPINVVWALGGLLGAHFLSLLLWVFGMVLAGPHAGGLVGRGWLKIADRITPEGVGASAARALAGLYRSADLVRWWLGSVTHGAWAIGLVGALLGLIAALSLRSYGFVWETTILPEAVFVRLVGLLGWLPAQLGFMVPEDAVVRSSGVAMAMDMDSRRAWSSWLVGCLVVYGIAPRLLLWAVCAVRLQAGRRRLRLDLALPGYARLARQLLPDSERIGVTDAAPVALTGMRAGQPRIVANDPPVLVGLELRNDFPWPPDLPPNVRDEGILENRQQRARLIDVLAAHPPVRLLVACDPRLSPDRGSISLISELSGFAGACRVWFVMTDGGSDPERLAHWRSGLAAAGFDEGAVMVDRHQALEWLWSEHEEA